MIFLATESTEIRQALLLGYLRHVSYKTDCVKKNQTNSEY